MQRNLSEPLPAHRAGRGGLSRRATTWSCAVAVALGSMVLGYAQASKQGGKAAESLKALAKTVQKGEDQVAKVTTALNQLVNKQNQDLRKPFKAYESEVKKLVSMAADARKRRVGLTKNRDAYLAAWDQDIATIQKEEIRNRSQERRQSTQQALDKLSQLASEVGKAYDQFELNLLDIQRAVGADLTPGGVEAITPTANEARKSAVALRDSLTKLRSELQSLGVAMSSKAPKP